MSQLSYFEIAGIIWCSMGLIAFFLDAYESYKAQIDFKIKNIYEILFYVILGAIPLFCLLNDYYNFFSKSLNFFVNNIKRFNNITLVRGKSIKKEVKIEI